MLWSDAHNHLLDPRLGDPEIRIREMKQAGVRQAVVNATCENEWPLLAHLATKHPDFIRPAYGIHPWKAHTAQAGWNDRLKRYLISDPRSLVGEIGLDGWVESPDFSVQTPVFEVQLALSRELNRTAVIHCLKAWQPLFDTFERVRPPSRFLLHSFGGSIEIARRLLPLGAYFSFSGYFLQPRKQAVVETFRQLPADRILVETDAPDMRPPGESVGFPLPDGINHPANLPNIARAFASHLGWSLENLHQAHEGNFCHCFSETTPLQFS